MGKVEAAVPGLVAVGPTSSLQQQVRPETIDVDIGMSLPSPVLSAPSISNEGDICVGPSMPSQTFGYPKKKRGTTPRHKKLTTVTGAPKKVASKENELMGNSN